MTYTFDDSIVSDLHKDAYGFRPTAGFMRFWAALSPEQKQVEWEDMCKTLAEKG